MLTGSGGFGFEALVDGESVASALRAFFELRKPRLKSMGTSSKIQSKVSKQFG